ncbi:hypothetical protein SLE2022_382800 [Rubroshorea leprosula]|uniref:Late embryogenesis abundant protein LEA-2 subgroup domain-containing protein n=1 Tax=Rubroshorea leprosula TaxID=152421 RepID=A0AAV5JFL8_9ROSI|nr:hypothetical protein SLEP1_g21569 [Rubroshorea leprosula]
MAPSKHHPPPPPPPPPPTHSHYYTPLPPQPPDQTFILLPLYRPENRHRRLPLICIFSLLMLAALSYLFWPSDPQVKIVRMHINRMQVHTIPVISVDISLLVTLKVHNADLYSMDYTTLDVAVGYRGKRLGHVRSNHGHVRAQGSSYVDAELDFNGVEVLSDVVFMLEDLAKGIVPFDTVTEVTGQIGLFFLKFPLKAKVYCEILVNRNTQSIMRQNCYPKSEMNLKP